MRYTTTFSSVIGLRGGDVGLAGCVLREGDFFLYKGYFAVFDKEIVVPTTISENRPINFNRSGSRCLVIFLRESFHDEIVSNYAGTSWGNFSSRRTANDDDDVISG